MNTLSIGQKVKYQGTLKNATANGVIVNVIKEGNNTYYKVKFDELLYDLCGPYESCITVPERLTIL